MAQGRKITQKQWENFEQYFWENPTSVGRACQHAGISTNTYYKRRVEDRSFAERIDDILDQVYLPLVETALVQKAISEGDGPSQRYYLSRRGGKKWNPYLPSNEKRDDQYTPEDTPQLKLAVDAFHKMSDKLRANKKGKKYAESVYKKMKEAADRL